MTKVKIKIKAITNFPSKNVNRTLTVKLEDEIIPVSKTSIVNGEPMQFNYNVFEIADELIENKMRSIMDDNDFFMVDNWEVIQVDEIRKYPPKKKVSFLEYIQAFNLGEEMNMNLLATLSQYKDNTSFKKLSNKDKMSILLDSASIGMLAATEAYKNMLRILKDEPKKLKDGIKGIH